MDSLSATFQGPSRAVAVAVGQRVCAVAGGGEREKRYKAHVGEGIVPGTPQVSTTAADLQYGCLAWKRRPASRASLAVLGACVLDAEDLGGTLF